MAAYSPRKLPGRWREGFALDLHSASSEFLGYDEFGHPQFDTTRSDLGQLLYRLKYQSDFSVVDEIAEAAATFVRSQWQHLEILVPVPASKPRARQPVSEIAEKLSSLLGLPLSSDAVQRVKDLPELKNVYDYDERLELLADAHSVDEAQVSGKAVLLFDDLYRSGATMNGIATALYEEGKASDVCALTITKTRSNR